MSRLGRSALAASLAALAIGGLGCARGSVAPLETFHWCAQPIVFSPPPDRWYREATNGSGLLGVRFVLKRGLGECITVVAYQDIAERDRRGAIEQLIERRHDLSRAEFLREVARARARADDPITDRESEASSAINAALDRALTDYLADAPALVRSDLEDALRAASGYELALGDVLPRIRFRPERMREPERWRVGYERDTTLAGRPSFAIDGTLLILDRPFLFREVYWVANRCAFKAVYQGTPRNLSAFERLVDSISFPEAAHDSTG